MANTYVKIASVTVGSGGAADIQFTSIPATYDDLALLVSVRTTKTGDIYGNMKLKFNTSTSNITGRFVRGVGGGVDSFSTTAAEWGAPTAASTASTFGNASFYFPNYAGSTNKSVSIDSVSENNTTDQFNYLSCGLWSITNAITGLTLYSSDAGANLAQYSTAVLYGIKKS